MGAKTKRRASPVIRLFPDSNDPGELLTFLTPSDICLTVGVTASTIMRWATSGHVRATYNKVGGSRHYSLLDAIRCRMMTKAERDEKGIILMPESHLAYNRGWHEQAQDRTVPNAEHAHEEWDDYDVEVVVEWTRSGKCIEDIADHLGRSYNAVSDRIEVLRESGDIPPARQDDGWLERSIPLLTPREVALIA